MKEICLSKGAVAIVDDDDYESLSKHKWYLHKGGAVHHRSAAEKVIFMHRRILNPPQGMCIDHINGNKLDNRRVNLRVCTSGENSQHRIKLPHHNTSGVLGVSWHKHLQKWQVRINVKKQCVCLGYFSRLQDAAQARREAEQKYFGEFAPSIREISCNLQ